jgi:glutathione S-transferase
MTGIQIWGRKNSVNVQKVLWCCAELDIVFERIDAGMAFGRNHDAEYLAMNPNGRIPTLVEGEFVLWESNAIMRYLVLAHGNGRPLYPAEPKLRAGVDRWLDWTLSTLQPAERPVFWGLVRTPAEQRDLHAIQSAANDVAALWRIIDDHLRSRAYMEGDEFSLADLALATYARRWFGVEGVEKPRFEHLDRWYRQCAGRAGFKTYVAPPLS